MQWGRQWLGEWSPSVVTSSKEFPELNQPEKVLLAQSSGMGSYPGVDFQGQPTHQPSEKAIP